MLRASSLNSLLLRQTSRSSLAYRGTLRARAAVSRYHPLYLPLAATSLARWQKALSRSHQHQTNRARVRNKISSRGAFIAWRTTSSDAHRARARARGDGSCLLAAKTLAHIAHLAPHSSPALLLYALLVHSHSYGTGRSSCSSRLLRLALSRARSLITPPSAFMSRRAILSHHRIWRSCILALSRAQKHV